jgi:acetyltransferase
VISQSGSVLVGVYEVAEDQGVGLRACVGVGNKADLNENDFLAHFMHDPGTKCVGMYIESFQDGEGFYHLAREASLRKPLVAVKVGTTPSGARAASSHTGAIATSSDALVNGILQQAGVLRVADDSELIDACKALANIGHIEGDRIAVIGSAGGFGVIASDYISSKTRGFGLTMATLSEATKEGLRKQIPAFGSVENPVDLTGVVTDQMYHDVIEMMQSEPGVDAILLNLLFQPPGMTIGLVDVAEKWARKGKKPMVVCCVGGSFPRPILRRLEEKGVPTYGTMRRAAFALRCLRDRGRMLTRLRKERER